MTPPLARVDLAAPGARLHRFVASCAARGSSVGKLVELTAGASADNHSGHKEALAKLQAERSKKEAVADRAKQQRVDYITFIYEAERQQIEDEYQVRDGPADRGCRMPQVVTAIMKEPYGDSFLSWCAHRMICGDTRRYCWGRFAKRYGS